MAVMPEKQMQGIGSLLVRAGLEKCRQLSHDFVVVLGHSHYYPRFGFRPADVFGLRCKWEVPNDVYMALELRKGALQGISAFVQYEPEFG